MNHHRRTFLKLGGAAFGAVATAALWPLRAIAAAVRPNAAFEATALDGAYKQLGGTPAESADIDLSTPDIAENGAVVPVSVTSKLPGTEAIYILIEKNPNPLAAGFMIPEGTEPFVSVRVKVAQTCNVIAVVKAGGKLYSAAKETKVTLGGCGG
ncbi:MAG: thiosulfate oxidation carrier protein SoxY [Nevskiales bacterium]|nr:thiosulfate oxidation carrier protein SoxY [Nevskiales bacterium]